MDAMWEDNENINGGGDNGWLKRSKFTPVLHDTGVWSSGGIGLSFFISVIDGSDGQLHALAALSPGISTPCF
jgi:hypothetical protein